jgi:hypothetical protein
MEEEYVDGTTNDINSNDSGEEENSKEAPIPNSWNLDYSTATTMNDGHDYAWVYHQNNISVGALYPDKQHLQKAITAWVISMQRVLKTIVSSKKFLIV